MRNKTVEQKCLDILRRFEAEKNYDSYDGGAYTIVPVRITHLTFRIHQNDSADLNVVTKRYNQ